jgi:hypothetical protein
MVTPEMTQQSPSARISLPCHAGPEAVYDLLADLRTHLDWGGTRQRRDFRLLTLHAPPGPAGVGATFSSTGTIPMSVRHWEDRSTVTAADRARVFEFITDASNGGARGMRARYRHRYELAPEASGSRVTYTITQLEVAHPMLRMALPAITDLTWGMAIPMLCGRGLRNLLVLAERNALSATSAQPPNPIGSIHAKEI